MSLKFSGPFYVNINKGKSTLWSKSGVKRKDRGKDGYNRGHLAPRNAFARHLDQYTTYVYENAVPQSTMMGGCLWAAFEDMIREHAEKRKVNTRVISGAWYGRNLVHNI